MNRSEVFLQSLSTKIKSISKKALLVTLLFLCSVAVLVQRVIRMTADPVGEKECPPANPDDNKNSTTTEFVNNDPYTAALPWVQKGGSINDASCLNKTAVHGIVKVTRVEDIKEALAFAKKNKLKVSMAGVKHSMGGQAFNQGGLILDMTGFNQFSVSEDSKTLTAQSGAIWHDIQNYLDPKGLSVKGMQSIDIFSVGGTISVNAHGADHHIGSIASTIKSMNIMLANGSIKRATPTENAELYQNIIGGYGLFGIILDVELDITKNEIYEKQREIISYKDFPEKYKKELEKNQDYGLFFSHFSTESKGFLDEMILYKYKRVENFTEPLPALRDESNTKLSRFIFNIAKTGDLGQKIKWWSEKKLVPMVESCFQSRNYALSSDEACLVTRNQDMHESLKFLKNNTNDNTDILQEYFLPHDKFVPFIDGLRDELNKSDIRLLSISLRIVNKGENTLNYAPEDMFAFVLYLNQDVSEDHNKQMADLTTKLIDLSQRNGGTFYLPYQLHYTEDQLKKSYPQIDTFFATKRSYDPDELITNKFYEKYAK